VWHVLFEHRQLYNAGFSGQLARNQRGEKWLCSTSDASSVAGLLTQNHWLKALAMQSFHQLIIGFLPNQVLAGTWVDDCETRWDFQKGRSSFQLNERGVGLLPLRVCMTQEDKGTGLGAPFSKAACILAVLGLGRIAAFFMPMAFLVAICAASHLFQLSYAEFPLV
jgi:hypothetical protein